MARKRYLIVGDGAAGLTAAEEIRRRDADAAVGLFCDDPNPGYFRAALTNFLLGELREDQLWAVAPDFYESRRIERVFTRVMGLDPTRRQIWCSGNPSPLGYDALLIATGSRARAPSFPGSHLPGVLTLRTVQDARRVIELLRGSVRRAVVLGGGALGLEWAHALLERGVHVTLMERAPRFLPGSLDAVASDLLSARLRQAGVEVLLGEEVVAAEPSPQGSLGGVVTNTGRRIPCEVLAAALGIVPNSELVAQSGIECLPNGAIRASRSLATSAAGVWAAGDVAHVDGEQLGLWEPARHQGRVAAVNMSGGEQQYRPGVHYFATRLFDLDFARVGDINEAPGSSCLIDFPRGTGVIAYRKLLVTGGRLRGALLMGERKAKVRTIGRGLKRLIDSEADVSSVAERLLDPSFDVSGFLETRKLLAPPEAKRGATRAVPAAKLRGTQVLSLGGPMSGLTARARTAVLAADTTSRPPGSVALPSGAALQAAGGGTAFLQGGTSALATAPRQTKMLSIGLHAEAPARAQPGVAPDARLEIAGRSIALSAGLSSIGAGPDATVQVSDPSVAFLHAQIAQQGDALYLRDAGTRTGTWVNGAPLSDAHRLRDGDRILVGQSELTFRSSTLGAMPGATEPVIAPPRLELRSGPGLGLSFVLPSGSRTLGSGPEADFQIFDPSVAPLHIRLRGEQDLHYLSDLGGPSGTYLRGAWLPAGQEVVLGEGELVQIGAVVLAFTRAPTIDHLAAFRPSAGLHVTSGAHAGKTVAFEERALVGSAPQATLELAGLAYELEIVRHQGAYFVRDLSGGRTFKSGVPLGPDYSPLSHGELLLVSAGALLRFEEA